ncbi:MAG: divergent polysaccharide deacetylase family protein [Desulfobulbaceae bacterium]|nr:divergent polysaccharide deacetylase family protein [Desulfobulbaceae bacterium]
MVATKKKSKKTVRKPKKKQRSWKTLIGFSLFFFTLGGLIVFLAIRTDKAIIPTGIDDAGSDSAVQYEEPFVTGGTGSGDRQGQSSQPEKQLAELKARPLVAIIIDDMGHNRKTCQALLELDLNLSFAFLPFGPYTEPQVDRARRLERDVLLHFPMEAVDAKWQPDGNTITINMDRTAIRRIFNANLNGVPEAIGINNHMGSRFTQNSRAMGDFMALVRDRDLFFLDSRTSRNSVGESVAAKMGVKTNRRDVFLDNNRETQAIVSQLRKLLDLADRQGRAIAIGHPYPETLKALKILRAEIKRRARVVGVGELVL